MLGKFVMNNNQEPVSAWIFGNSSVRVGTHGLFRPYVKTFVPPFLPSRLTAPGSPRMGCNRKDEEGNLFLYRNWVKCFSEFGSFAANFVPVLVKCLLRTLEITDSLLVAVLLPKFFRVYLWSCFYSFLRFSKLLIPFQVFLTLVKFSLK